MADVQQTNSRPSGLGRRFRAAADSILTLRLALHVSLLVAWVNFLGTVKWAHVAGALNGWKRPWYGLALAVATVLSFAPRAGRAPVRLGKLPFACLVAGVGLLSFAFFAAFPPSTWSQLPILDDWPPRFQVTMDGIGLLRRGAVAGWQWAFLGGYHTASNLGQSLTFLAFVPVELFGPRLGFHLLHALLVAAIPVLLYWDLRQEGSAQLAALTAAFACVTATGTFGTIVPSGDTNSIAGIVCVLVALVGSRAARLGRRWGPPLLLLGLVLTVYSHAAFFVYAAVYLVVEAIFYRDRRAGVRALAALAIATLVGLPLWGEIAWYRGYTTANNVAAGSGAMLPSYGLLRNIYYNLEILAQPHRWYNDYIGLSNVFLAISLVMAFRVRSRAGFYAAAAVATIAMLRLDVPQAGYLFVRECHMLAIFAPPILAWFIVERSGLRSLAVALIAVVGLYVQAQFIPRPHVRDVREFNPALVDRIAALDGNLVLVENNPHRNMSLVAGQRSERSAFGIHFEALLPPATGKRFYGEEWDGWVWSRFRYQVVAGGTFAGRPIATVPISEFVTEMRKWGIRHLVVWSEPTTRYLAASELFARRWAAEPWSDFELLDADTRGVVVPAGSGRLENLDALGGDVDLAQVRAGDTVVVRTNFYPAWRARAGADAVALFDLNGQLAFRAPRGGTYRVHLEYPRRTGLLVAAGLLLVAGMIALIPLRGIAPPRSMA